MSFQSQAWRWIKTPSKEDLLAEYDDAIETLKTHRKYLAAMAEQPTTGRLDETARLLVVLHHVLNEFER